MINDSTQNSLTQDQGRRARRRKLKVLFSRRATRFRPLLEQFEGRQLLALVINPTFASNITSDPNAATIEATINRAIQAYESSFSDNITVNITFQEGDG